MKKIILSLFVAATSVLSGTAQLTEGHVSFKIDMSTDNPDMQMAIGMMQGSTLEMYFKEKTTRAEMKMGTMMNITTISNETSGDVLMLMSGMVGQNAIKTTTEELSKKEEDKPKMEVTLVDESKTIMDYACKKAVLTDPEGNEMTYWYTEEISVAKAGQSYLNNQVPGFPMQFEMNNGGMKMSMTVTAIEKKLDKKSSSLFDMSVPEGYKEMTMEDLMKMGM